MAKSQIFIEEGRKRTFAGSIDWPGWCRSGKDQQTAIDMLIKYGTRFNLIADIAGLSFLPPQSTSDLQIIEVVEGNATTSFGAPAVILESDFIPAGENDYDLWRNILKASWKSLDDVCQRALSKELKKGPRGGGRDLDRILSHIIDGDVAYLKKTALSYKPDPENDLMVEINHLRKLILETLERAEKDGFPEKGPRGGMIWPVRFFIRRVVWHTLDHLWEIEDRIMD